MNRTNRPAGRGTSPRRWLNPLTALAAASLMATLAASPTQAGWEPETPVEGTGNTRPAIAMDTEGHLGVAWQTAGGTPGILFATDAPGTWSTTRVSTGDDWSPDVAFDASGAAHVVYARFGQGAGLYYATNASGSWVSRLLRTDVTPWSPQVALDAAGKLHVAYASEGFTPGIYHYTNASGSWLGTRVTTSTWDSEPSLAIDASGTIRIAFARYEPTSPGIFVRSRAAGSTAWTEARASSGPVIDDYPSLRIDGAGKLHVAFLRYDADGNRSLRYVTNASGAWVQTAPAVPGSVQPGVPSLGLDGSGAPEVVVGVFGDDSVDTLYRFAGPGLATAEALIAPERRSSDYPDVLRDASGRLTVAYRNAQHEPGLYVHRESPDETTAIAGSTYLASPAIEGRGDFRYLVLDRYAEAGSDGTTLAVREAGAWTETTIDPGAHGAPDLAVSGPVDDADLYVTNPDRLLWDVGAGWQGLDFLASSDEASLALGQGASAEPIVAYTTDAGIRIVDRWGESQLTTDPADWNPDLAIGEFGIVGSQVLTFMRGDDVYAAGTSDQAVIELVSDPSWVVDDADPSVGPPLSLPGPAQRVCLNDTSPPGCPEDAVRYGHAGSGWDVDLSSIPGAAWIWAPGITGQTSPADGDAYTFTRSVSLASSPLAASIRIGADDGAEVLVNGQPVGSVSWNYSLSTFDIAPHLVPGQNTITIRAANANVCGMSCPYSSNPGGVVFRVSITVNATGGLPPGARRTWAPPQLLDGTSAWDPTVAISEHSGTFVAYDHHSTNPGIYVARAATVPGTWTSTRLSRSWADGRPVIVTGPPTSADPLVEDNVHVAWVRGCQGAAPGIYVARNGPGWTWTVSRVVSTCDVEQVAMDIVNGQIVLAYADRSTAIRTMTEAPTGATVGAGTAAAGLGEPARSVDTTDGSAPSTQPTGPSGEPATRDTTSSGPGRRVEGGGSVVTMP